MKAKQGVCQDPGCDMADEKTAVRLFRTLYRCDGCIEMIQDNDTFTNENWAEMRGY